MSIPRIARLCVLVLLPVLATVLTVAQGNRDFGGKWVVDREKMLEIEPAWDGVLTRDMWIATSGARAGIFKVARSVDEYTTRSSDNIDTYDPSANPTTISLPEGHGLAHSQWEGDRLIVRITVPGSDHAFTRIFYRDGQWLVVEEHDRPTTRWIRTYFVKS